MPPTRLDQAGEERCWLGVRDAERFFMGEAEVQKASPILREPLNEGRIALLPLSMLLEPKLASGMTAPDLKADTLPGGILH